MIVNRTVVVASFVAAFIIVKSGFITMMGMFLLFGIVPGTRYSLPSGVMLILFGVVIWLLFCQRGAMYYVRMLHHLYTIHRRVTPTATRISRRRYNHAQSHI